MDIKNLFEVVLDTSHDGILIMDNQGIVIFDETYHDKPRCKTPNFVLQLPWQCEGIKEHHRKISHIGKNNVIALESLPPHIIQREIPPDMQTYSLANRSLKKMVSEYENRIVEKLFETYRSTYKVAEMLGVSQPTIVRKIHRSKGMTDRVKKRVRLGE